MGMVARRDDPLVDFSIRVGAPKNLAKLNLQQRKYILWAGGQIIDILRQQMASGRTADGRAYPKLTVGYAILKTKAGHGNRADFAFTHSLLNSMKLQVRSNGNGRVNFGGLHSTATTRANATLQARAEAIRQRAAKGKKITPAQERLVALAELGKRSMTNQELADTLARRTGTGTYVDMVMGRPEYEFMQINQATRERLLDGYQRIVISEQLVKLPPTITEADIKPELRKYLTVKPTKAWKGK